MNNGVTISKRYIKHMGGVLSFVTGRFIWVGGVEKHDIYYNVITEWSHDINPGKWCEGRVFPFLS